MEMKNDEKVPDYLIRLMTLTYKMKNYGDVMVEEVVIEKVFRTLTPKIDHIVPTIEETKELSEVNIEYILSILEAYALKFIKRINEDEHTFLIKFKNNHY